MRLACAILLFVGARAAGVAPAETLASAVPAEKKNPIDAVEATYGRVGFAGPQCMSAPSRMDFFTASSFPSLAARQNAFEAVAPADAAQTSAAASNNLMSPSLYSSFGRTESQT